MWQSQDVRKPLSGCSIPGALSPQSEFVKMIKTVEHFYIQFVVAFKIYEMLINGWSGFIIDIINESDRCCTLLLCDARPFIL